MPGSGFKRAQTVEGAGVFTCRFIYYFFSYIYEKRRLSNCPYPRTTLLNDMTSTTF